MATSFKSFLNNDVTTTRALLHEAIPITGSIVSGTYDNPALAVTESNAGNNIKNYSHGLFQSVYDYPFLSSSANHIFDLTAGYSNKSNLSASANTQNADKINIYNQMAQLLVGHDQTGSIREFDADGNLSDGAKLQECLFFNFARILQKDEIKKNSFNLKLGVSGSFMTGSGANAKPTEFNELLTITDTNANTSYKVNSPAGEYAVLYATGATTPANTKVGLLYYQAGVAVLTASVMLGKGTDSANAIVSGGLNGGTGVVAFTPSGQTINQALTSVSISGSCDSLRHRLYDLDFNNTTELNSTVYFCRAGHSEFNYSSNPTYISNASSNKSQIRVKNSSLDQPVSYITTVGLYSADNELLAVAKVSEPLKKTPDTELTLRVRLDF
tara:strand:- start:1109 stop:2263 length:1155 start_codon:yes stop_codon:yes gene_type:complete